MYSYVLAQDWKLLLLLLEVVLAAATALLGVSVHLLKDILFISHTATGA